MKAIFRDQYWELAAKSGAATNCQSIKVQNWNNRLTLILKDKFTMRLGKLSLWYVFPCIILIVSTLPVFIFVLLSVFNYWSLIVFVIFTFSACVMICRWIMICCWLTRTYKTFVAHCLNKVNLGRKDRKRIRHRKEERE